MADMPRIITVDPTGNIARIVRSAMDLLDLSIIQVDVPTTGDALEELDRKANLVVTAFVLDDDMKGWEFAMRIKKKSADTAVIILGDSDDPDEFDEETTTESPFVYMSRPVDIHRFLRVLVGGLESHEAMIAALAAPAGGGGGADNTDMGPVPNIDIDAATAIVDGLLTDLGAMALILAARNGEILLERGAVGYIDRDSLAPNLIPIMLANIGIKDMVGGNVSTVQLYDGEDYDIFMLTVGLHHMLCVVFDGSQGARQFGLVNRFGRRAVEDLIALIGANAFFIMPPVKKEEALPHKSAAAKKAKKVQEEEIELAPAFERDDDAGAPAEPEPAMQLDAIPDDEFDLDALFGGDVGDDADDLFDLEKMEELAKDDATQRKDVISWEDAEGLGLINKK